VQTVVKSHMTGSPVSIEAGASALEALDLMIDHGIRHLPVLDARGAVCGVLSIDDLRAAFPLPVGLSHPPGAAERVAMRDLAVAEVMTYGPLTVRSDTPLEEAAQLMAERRIGCLPVVGPEGGLEGMLSETDLLHALVTTLWTERVSTARRPEPARDVVEALQAERRQLVAHLSAYGRHERELTETLRDTPSDEGDAGSEREEAILTEQLADSAARRLRAIENALERAASGELGRCESCGGRIPESRLRALPEATLCVRCARKVEATAR
jgi:CBS domain-containing protein/RNA polymerase-binding transcription factor DksA